MSSWATLGGVAHVSCTAAYPQERELTDPSDRSDGRSAFLCDVFELLGTKSLGLVPIRSPGLHRVPLKVSTALNGQSLVVNIANDMRLGLQDNVATLNGTLDPAVHNHSLRRDSSGDMSLARDHERRAVQFPVDLSVDLH
jgi:hypothetical protein